MVSFDWDDPIAALDRRLLVLEAVLTMASVAPDGVPLSGSNAGAFYYGLVELLRDVREELRRVLASGDGSPRGRTRIPPRSRPKPAGTSAPLRRANRPPMRPSKKPPGPSS